MLSLPVPIDRAAQEDGDAPPVSRPVMRTIQAPWTTPGEPVHFAGLQRLGLRDADQFRPEAARAETVREQLQRKLSLLRAEQRDQASRLASLEWRNSLLTATNANLGTRLEAIERSTTWRITAPLRHAADRFPRVSGLARRLGRLIWWTATFQLASRLRAWQEYRRARRYGPSTVLAVPIGTACGPKRLFCRMRRIRLCR